MQQNITITGNLTGPIELSDVGENRVARFRVAVNPTYQTKTGEWEKEPAVFWRVEAWGRLGVNAAEVLAVGNPIIVVGTVHTNEWETEEGEKRSSTFIRADDLGFSFKFGTNPQAQS